MGRWYSGRKGRHQHKAERWTDGKAVADQMVPLSHGGPRLVVLQMVHTQQFCLGLNNNLGEISKIQFTYLSEGHNYSSFRGLLSGINEISLQSPVPGTK